MRGLQKVILEVISQSSVRAWDQHLILEIIEAIKTKKVITLIGGDEEKRPNHLVVKIGSACAFSKK